MTLYGKYIKNQFNCKISDFVVYFSKIKWASEDFFLINKYLWIVATLTDVYES